MRRLVTCALVILGLFCLIPTQVRAHDLENSNDIGAIMHIDPYDDPVINEPQVFIFYFKSSQGSFNLDLCECQIEVFKPGGSVVFSQALVPVSQAISNNPYTFSEPGEYIVKVTGKPVGSASFSDFELEYDIRVKASINELSANRLSFKLALGLVLLQGLAVVGAYTLSNKKR